MGTDERENRLERSDEIALALGLTMERETASGRPWCPPATATRLKRYLTGYAKELDGLSHQGVRLFYAMETAHPNGVAGFLYGALKQLTPDHFRSAFGNTGLGTSGAFDGNTLRLTEPGLAAASGKPFELSVKQMPLVAAYLDAAHNMLGFDPVHELVLPLWSGDGARASDVAAALRTALSNWMRPGLQKEHYLRQARVIAAFLQTRAITRPDGIDDETIIALWESQAKLIRADALDEKSSERPTEGFKTYQNAARLTLYYRQALQTAWNERNAQSDAVSIGSADNDDGRIVEIGVGDRQLQTAAGFDGDESGSDDSEWISPLVALREEPGSRVKWTKKQEDMTLLAGLIDSQTLQGNTHADSKALFQTTPPLMSHLRTIVRYSVLGPLQTKWSSGSGDRPAADAQNGYAGFISQLARLVDGFETVRLAAAHVLVCRQNTHGAALLSEIDPHAARTAFRLAGLGPSLDGDWREELAVYFEDSDDAFAKSTRAAYEAINRAGFRKQDRLDDDLMAGLEAGAPSLTALLGIVSALAAELETAGVVDRYDDDCARFVETFEMIYGRDNNVPATG
ncbi:MAG: hypothetical protein NXH88_01660 [Hyphomonas sp.]|nr:hypothetical protein [Hyphomonas sp.]